MSGVLEVGLMPGGKEIVVNHPDLEPDENGCGHIIFSPMQALMLAMLLIKKVTESNYEHFRGYEGHVDDIT